MLYLGVAGFLLNRTLELEPVEGESDVSTENHT